MRRRVALAAAALAGLGAGVGAALWSRRASDVAPDAADAFWRRSFPRVDGTPLAFASLRGRPLLLNFWAPWCVPCVAEMPMLDRFHQAQRGNGWSVLGLAIDAPAPVRDFVAAHRISFPVVLGGDGGVELARRLGNRVGGLPYSVLFDRQGRVQARQAGALDDALLAAWTAAA